jgi:hypothetical protein
MRIAALVCLAFVAGCSSGPATSGSGFRAGTAKVKTTPAVPMMMAGYGSRNKPSEGTARDLYVRVLALEDSAGGRVVVVTADIIGFGPVIGQRIKEAVRKQYGVDEARVLLVGSHTHNGPVIAERALVDHPEQVREKDEYADALVSAVVGRVGEAIGSLGPATLSLGRGEARFAMNRRVPHPDGTWRFGDNPKGPTDPDVPVLVVESPEGVTKAILYTYACHNTSIRNGKEGFYKFHPDYAGVASQTLEAQIPGAVAMYVTGCGGDIDPGPKAGVEAAEESGQAMAKAVLSAMGKGLAPVGGPIRTGLRRIDLPLEKPSREQYEKMAASGKEAEKKWAQEVLGAVKPTGSISYPVQVWRFGKDLALAALAGETCVDYVLRLKREIGAEKLWVAGYSNEVMCYIPSERVLGEGGYEAGWTPAWGRNVAASQMAWSGWPAPFAPGIEDRIVSAVHALLKE